VLRCGVARRATTNATSCQIRDPVAGCTPSRGLTIRSAGDFRIGVLGTYRLHTCIVMEAVTTTADGRAGPARVRHEFFGRAGPGAQRLEKRPSRSRRRHHPRTHAPLFLQAVSGRGCPAVDAIGASASGRRPGPRGALWRPDPVRRVDRHGARWCVSGLPSARGWHLGVFVAFRPHPHRVQPARGPELLGLPAGPEHASARVQLGHGWVHWGLARACLTISQARAGPRQSGSSSRRKRRPTSS
jgi:hypothetical protein